RRRPRRVDHIVVEAARGRVLHSPRFTGGREMRAVRFALLLLALPACAKSRAGAGEDANPADVDAPAAIIDAAIDAAPGTADASIDAGLGPTGMTWPADQVFPSFAAIGSLDVIGIAGRPNDVMALLTSLQGIVNRTRPRIFLDEGGDRDRLWLGEIGAPVTHV